jgi:myo-inositol 2-dehydrogenase/D-chiro-inositol 1-dehydrogenase
MEYYREAGGLLRDMTIHDFDIARFMLQEDPKKVFAIANALEEPKLKSELNDFDTVMVIMETESGKQCHINNSRSSKYGYDQRIELVGNKGMVLSDNKKISNVKKYSANGENTSTVEHFFLERYHEAFMNGLTSFSACIENKTIPDVGFEDGRKALLLAEAAYESLKTHQMVNVNYD